MIVEQVVLCILFVPSRPYNLQDTKTVSSRVESGCVRCLGQCPYLTRDEKDTPSRDLSCPTPYGELASTEEGNSKS